MAAALTSSVNYMASVLDRRLVEGIQLSHKLIETHVFDPDNVSLIIIQIIEINVVDRTRIHIVMATAAAVVVVFVVSRRFLSPRKHVN